MLSKDRSLQKQADQRRLDPLKVEATNDTLKVEVVRMRQRIEADNVWLAGEAEESKLELAERDNRVESELTKALEEGVVVEARCREMEEDQEMVVNLMREQQELDKEMYQNLIAQQREQIERLRSGGGGGNRGSMPRQGSQGRRSASRCGCSSNRAISSAARTVEE